VKQTRPDFRQFYFLEKYLFDVVGPRFLARINSVDFFMIIAWKSNRAKTRVRDRLKRHANGNFSKAVVQIARALSSAKTARERLELLMQDWGLRLPMASAILTVLYPDEFTVYDYRVCEALNRPYKDKSFPEYQSYKSEVIKNTPPNLSLRDRDRYLWGKSFWKHAKADAQ
jgi:hypothetical protein